MIFSEDGLQILHRTQPVRVGGDLKLYCTSEGGDPPPSLAWRRASVPVSPVGQDVDNLSGRVTSTVVMSGLSQADLGALVTCTADNSVLIQPQTATVVLDVIGKDLQNMFIHYLVNQRAIMDVKLKYLFFTRHCLVPPVRAKIVREWSHFTAGDIYNITCQVRQR